MYVGIFDSLFHWIIDFLAVTLFESFTFGELTPYWMPGWQRLSFILWLSFYSVDYGFTV